MNNNKQTGFTIVELLIVIVVIGILAAITMVAYNNVQERARVSQANSELKDLNQAIQAARINAGTTLYGVTNSYCTRCSDQARYELTLDRISAASGANLNNLKDGDPRGAKYAIDENEGERANPCANRDGLTLLTTGKSGILSQTIPFFNNCP